jgi:hypothetical protein
VRAAARRPFYMEKVKIYRDLKNSPFIFHHGDMTFHFSSQLYLSKYAAIYESEIKRFNTRTNNIYKDKFNLEVQNLGLIRLYEIIEKRGFYIKIREEPVTCLTHLRFELETKILS